MFNLQRHGESYTEYFTLCGYEVYFITTLLLNEVLPTDDINIF